MAETVKVVRDGPRGWHLINEQDFDPAKHVLWEPEIAAKEAEIKENAAKHSHKAAKKADTAQPTQDK